MTVPACVMLDGPVYAVRLVPEGTPVLVAPGKPVGGGGVGVVFDTVTVTLVALPTLPAES